MTKKKKFLTAIINVFEERKLCNLAIIEEVFKEYFVYLKS